MEFSVNNTPTVREAYDTLREIVEGNPEYTYEKRTRAVPDAELEDLAYDEDLDPDPSCFYVHVDSAGTSVPGCVVGQWLNRQGVDLHDLRQHENRLATSVVEHFFPELDGEVNDVLSAVQNYQDTGIPWGDALRISLEENGVTLETEE